MTRPSQSSGAPWGTRNALSTRSATALMRSSLSSTCRYSDIVPTPRSLASDGIVTASDPCESSSASAASTMRSRDSVLRGTLLLLAARSEEHTSELQSRQYLVCRLLLEKKKNQFSHKETNRKIKRIKNRKT